MFYWNYPRQRQVLQLQSVSLYQQCYLHRTQCKYVFCWNYPRQRLISQLQYFSFYYFYLTFFPVQMSNNLCLFCVATAVNVTVVFIVYVCVASVVNVESGISFVYVASVVNVENSIYCVCFLCSQCYKY